MKLFIPALVFVGLLCSTAFAQPKWLDRAQQLEQQFGQRSAVTALELIRSQNDRTASALACGRADGSVTIFDLKDSRVLTQHNLGNAVPIAFSPRGDTIVSLHSDESNQAPVVTLWDMQTGKARHKFIPRLGQSFLTKVMAIAFSPDGSVIAVAGGYFYFQGVGLWDVKTGEFLRALEPIPGDAGASEGAYTVAFAPDGRRIAANSRVSRNRGGDDYEGNAIGVWDVVTGKWQRTIKLRRSHLNAALIWRKSSSQGETHIADTDGAVINSWDAETGEWKASGEQGQTFQRSRMDSAGGRDDNLLLASGHQYLLSGNNTTVKVWSWSGLRLLSTITSPIPITRAIFISDETVACGLVDGTVRLWRIQQKPEENP